MLFGGLQISRITVGVKMSARGYQVFSDGWLFSPIYKLDPRMVLWRVFNLFKHLKFELLILKKIDV